MPENHERRPGGPTARDAEGDIKSQPGDPAVRDADGDIEKLLGEVLPAIAAQVAAANNYDTGPATLAAVNAALAKAWDEFTNFGELVYIIADACRVTGVTFGVYQNEGYFQFKTVFSPSLRYDHDNPDDIALGFFKNYDLYYSRRGATGRLLLARYGDKKNEFFKHDPDELLAKIVLDKPIKVDHEAMFAAFDRAQRANLFAGSNLTGNDGLGALMIPELTVLEYRQNGSQTIDLNKL